MRSILRNLRTTIFIIPLLTLLFIAACGHSEQMADAKIQATTEAATDVIITIGSLTDLTGVSSLAMESINMALEDTVEYFNENELIPGAELKIITYDSQYNPDRTLPGYEWLMGNGADFIWTPVPRAVESLKYRANADQLVIFTASANLEDITLPTYVFNTGIIPQHNAFTLLKWIAENDWDYDIKGPAKIGGATWDDSVSTEFFPAMKEYAEEHSNQFEFVGGYVLPIGNFNWESEVEALKECDYVYTPTPMNAFVRQFREMGYTATFIGTDIQAAFMGMIDDGNLWDEIDGMLFSRATRWWNEEGSLIDLTKELLIENHPSEADEIMRSGSGYLAVAQAYIMLQIIAEAVEVVGPQSFDSYALYNAAQSYCGTIDDVDRFSFNETKRYSTNSYGIYEARGTERDLFRVDSNWRSAILQP